MPYSFLGWSAFAGVGVFVLAAIVQLPISRLQYNVLSLVSFIDLAHINCRSIARRNEQQTSGLASLARYCTVCCPLFDRRRDRP